LSIVAVNEGQIHILLLLLLIFFLGINLLREREVVLILDDIGNTEFFFFLFL
jgi:hypothetical protein